MRTLITIFVLGLVLAVGAPFATAQTSADVTVAGGLSLPTSHRYEIYDTTTQKYSPITVAEVPSYVQRGQRVYDRTAGAWVLDPSGNLNARYKATAGQVTTGAPATTGAQASASADPTVIDGMSLPSSHRYEIYDTTTQKYSPIGVREVPSYVRRGQRVYDRTAGTWVLDPSGNLNKRYLAAGSTGVTAGTGTPGDGQGGRGRQWDRVDGIVQSVNGNEVTVRTDDGRTVVVDISQARANVRNGVTNGERISAMGHVTGTDRFQARVIRDMRGKNAAAGAQPGQSGDWQRIHGRVQTINGANLRFRADDGRVLDVDMTRVSADIQRGLTRGEQATVIGYEWLGPNKLRAEYIQQDSSDASRQPAASPK